MEIKFGRRDALALATSMLAAIVTAPALGAEPIRLQATTIAPPDNVWSKTGDRYAEAVKKRTGGRVEIAMSYSGALGNAAATIEALKFNTINIVIQEVGQLDVYNPLAGLGSYPYLIRDIEHFRVVMEKTDVGRKFHDEIEKRAGFKLIGAGFRGPREMASRRPIQTPADLAGLKMRIPSQQMFRKTWATLGASPVPMPSLEVYTALQQGIIDAAENPLEAQIRSKYYEAVPYVIMTSHVNAYYTFIMDATFFKSLPKDVQAVLGEEGENAMRWGGDQVLGQIEAYKQRLSKAGTKIIEPDVAAFRKKLEPMKADFPAEIQEWIERFQNAGKKG